MIGHAGCPGNAGRCSFPALGGHVGCPEHAGRCSSRDSGLPGGHVAYPEYAGKCSCGIRDFREAMLNAQSILGGVVLGN